MAEEQRPQPDLPAQPSGSNETSGRGGGRGGRRGRGRDRGPVPRSVRVSKALARVLRHRAGEVGLEIGPDGYARVDEVLRTPPLRSIGSLPADPATGARGPVTLAELARLVLDNDKNRFSLRRRPRPDGSSSSGDNDVDGGDELDLAALASASAPATAADLSSILIRANQGHSLAAVETEQLLQPVTLGPSSTSSSSSSPPPPPLLIHGTTLPAWAAIRQSGGLSRMGRRHVHFAQGLPGGDRFAPVAEAYRHFLGTGGGGGGGDTHRQESAAGIVGEAAVVSGMRPTSSVLVFLDLEAAIRSGLTFWMSENGVVLSEGNADGFVPLENIKVALDIKGNVLYPVP